MGFLDGIRGIIFRETCVRAKNYDKRNLEMRFIAEALDDKFSSEDLKTEKDLSGIHVLELLDNYQYELFTDGFRIRVN
jgi:hypothetical protein